MMDRVLSEHISGHARGKSCLTNPIAFDTKAWFLDEGKGVDVICVHFSKTFNTASLNILLSILG